MAPRIRRRMTLGPVSRSADVGPRGQILVLFALVLVLILVSASIVIDLGVLRNNRQTLVNAMDAGALAGGTLLPVNGATEGAKADALIDLTVQANYPGISKSSYTIRYVCLVGVTGSPASPAIARDVPVVCDPSKSLGRAPVAGDFSGAGQTRFVACRPDLGDKCNAVTVSGAINTSYGFGRVVGVDHGSTGVVNASACNGPCGESPNVPVDVVLIIDRTLSMQDPGEMDALQTGASTVLSVFDPALQRVALGSIGPSQVNGSNAPTKGACPTSSTSPVKNLSSPNNQVLGVGQTNASNINFFSVPSDIGRWVPVGFSGTDGQSPAVASGWGFNEAYSSNGVTNTNSTLWKAISCFYAYTQGTNLDTPVAQARQYLATYGRPGVKKGIIFETDGTPQAGDGSSHYTCAAANSTAAAAKAAGIEMFTIGFGITGATCPSRTSPNLCANPSQVNANETAAWSCKPVSTLLTSMATDASHFFNAPDSATLIDAFKKAAQSLAGKGAHLIALYPPPIVTAVAPATTSHLGGATLTVTGQYFTGATSVKVGAVAATFSVLSDTSISVTVPAGTQGATVHLTVTTPGGTSPTVSGDRVTYN